MRRIKNLFLPKNHYSHSAFLVKTAEEKPFNAPNHEFNQRQMEKEISINAQGAALSGTLSIPAKAKGIVVFAHGSGSSRLSPRNVFVAKELQKAGFATLLFDLLTEQEDEVYQKYFEPRVRRFECFALNRFNIPLLAKRLNAGVQMAQSQSEYQTNENCFFRCEHGRGSRTASARGIFPARFCHSKPRRKARFGI